MFRLVEWLARRDSMLARRGSEQQLRSRRARLRVAIYMSIAALALTTPLSALAQDGPLGPHVRVKGLPASTTLSGGQTNAKRDWLVPLRARGALKIEIASSNAGNLDLNVALVGDKGDALGERRIALRVKPAAASAPSPEAEAKQRSKGANTSSVGFRGRPDDVSLGPHFRIVGLPTDVTLSGGLTNAEQPWVIALPDGKQAWMVPLWALDDLRVELPPGFTGNLDLVVALADNAGGVVAERTVALRMKPAVAAVRSGPGSTAEQRKDVTVATPAPPPSGAALPARSPPEPTAETRKDVAVTMPAPAPAGPAAVVPSPPERIAKQRKDVAVATPAPPPARPAPAVTERACAVADCRPSAEEPQQAERLLKQGERYLAQGNIAIARQYFARAADLGLAIAALKIAETYDPNELARPDVYGVKPNLTEARRWYQRAVELDVPEAQARVQRLGTR